jgi:hypothetical protein
MITARIALGLDVDLMRFAAARESVLRLGLVKPDAEGSIFRMLDVEMAEHPRSITTRFRQDGEQLSRDQKKIFGLRANAFFSRKAFVEDMFL